MTIYERPTKALMADWAKLHLTQGQTFKKDEPVRWFHENYPNIKSNTVSLHVEGMAVNNSNRKHHPNIRPGTGYDLFYKLRPGEFRLWDPDKDGRPLYTSTIEQIASSAQEPDGEEDGEAVVSDGERSFAYERDLRNYLVRNLALIEPGLQLYEEEGITGVEYPVGGRFIDVLAVDRQRRFVVIELKVSRGYDRVVGQLLRYMAWVDKNLADDGRPARGIIVANQINDDLRLACSRVGDVKLIEYEISFTLRPLESV